MLQSVCVSMYAMEGVRGCVNVRAYMGVIWVYSNRVWCMNAFFTILYTS